MNNNPYKVLGVSPDADDETVKKAYRELARKYHPDRYADTDLAELASEKMKEINAAYEEINRLRAEGASGQQSSNYGYNGTGYSYQTSGAGYQNGNYSAELKSKFKEIRGHINSGRIDEAERLLFTIDRTEGGAEWIFLHGCVQLHRRNYVDAQRDFETAYRMEPTNNEYWTFKEQMHRRAGGFGSGYRTSRGDCGCDPCTTLCLVDCCCDADCCCECMGGDLIPGC